jgi:hypothetical protein
MPRARRRDFRARKLDGLSRQFYPALLQAYDAVGGGERARDVLFDEDRGCALGDDRRQRLVDVAYDDGGEAEAEFVEQNEFGI